MNLIEWLDQYNYIHIKPNPTPDQTENPLTFTATLHTVYKLCKRDYSKLAKPNLKTNILPSGEFITTPISKAGSHFSLDSMTGLYILDYINEYEDNLDLPLMEWYKSKKSPKVQKFYRPDVIVFFMFLKFPFLAKFLFPLLAFFATISCMKAKGVTSGKIQWFTRFGALAVGPNEELRKYGEKGLALIDKKLKGKHGDRPMIDCLRTYYKDLNHPIHGLIKEYYSKRS